MATLCEPFAVPTDESGVATADLLSVTFDSSSCDCAAPGLAPAPADAVQSADVVAQISGECTDPPKCSNACVCRILPATDASLAQCQTVLTPDSTATGWCYVSAEQSAAASALVTSTCDLGQQHEIRLLGSAAPSGDATLVLVDRAGGKLPSSPTKAELGDTCVNSDETYPGFAGYSADDVVVDDEDTTCRSGICLQNHFQGRVSCPYGQATADGSCLVAGSAVPVGVAVKPQLQERQASVASICSCHCAGDGPGPYCTCPSNMECVHLVDDVYYPSSVGSEYSGSYCIPAGSEYSKTQTSECTAGSCGDSHPF